MKFFLYDNEKGLTLNSEPILLISEFKALMELKRNKTTSDKTGKERTRAFKEFAYIYLFFDWESPYFQLPEQERHAAAFADSELTLEEFEDPLFRTACNKYEELQNSSISIRLLKSAMKSVETLIYYLEHVDVNERNPADGKPIYKTKDLIAEIKGSKDVIVGIKQLELQVKKDLDQESGLRGNTEPGYFD
jgi:hypothetical protein